MTKAVMVVALTVLAGCSRENDDDRRPGTGDGQRATVSVQNDTRSQRDLAQEIAGAERLRKDEAEERYGQIRASWLGKRVTWTLDLLPALCRSAGECHALPFDRLGADRAIVQGWMPRLRLDPATFAALQAGCAGRARCPVTVEGTVAELALSTEEPTSLTLAGVRLPAALASSR